jgi:hypothetical protein
MFMGADIVVKAVRSASPSPRWSPDGVACQDRRAAPSGVAGKARLGLLESDTTLTEVEHASQGALPRVAQIIHPRRETSLSAASSMMG